MLIRPTLDPLGTTRSSYIFGSPMNERVVFWPILCTRTRWFHQLLLRMVWSWSLYYYYGSPWWDQGVVVSSVCSRNVWCDHVDSRVTMPSRYRIRSSSPGCLTTEFPYILKYWIATSGCRRNIYFSDHEAYVMKHFEHQKWKVLRPLCFFLCFRCARALD